MFKPDELNALVSSTLSQAPTIPDGHKNAFVTAFDAHGVHAVLATKVGDHWMVEAGVVFDPESKHVDAGVSIIATW